VKRMYYQGDVRHLYIGGRWVLPESTDRIEVISPVTEDVLASVPDASRADVNRAVSAARQAFDKGPWSRMTLAERIAFIRKLSGFLDENKRVVGETITTEMGSPRSVDWMQSDSLSGWVNAYIEVALAYPFSVVRPSSTGVARVDREPVGVVAAIVPWNAPVP